jgi:hypothetical protein
MNVGVQFGLTNATSDTALKFQGSLAFWWSEACNLANSPRTLGSPPLAHSGLFERARCMSAIGCKADISHNGSTDAY